jgi:tripartite-type tricarboxylate transporter receptor subunit TctC
MAESGFPGFEATTWYGLVGPGKMPVAMARRMNEDVNKALVMPDVMEKLEASGAEDGGGSAEKFKEFMHVEQAKWAKVIKEANVKVDRTPWPPRSTGSVTTAPSPATGNPAAARAA